MRDPAAVLGRVLLPDDVSELRYQLPSLVLLPTRVISTYSLWVRSVFGCWPRGSRGKLLWDCGSICFIIGKRICVISNKFEHVIVRERHCISKAKLIRLLFN